MNVRLSAFATLAAALSLAVACGEQALDNGSAIVGPSTAGQSSNAGGVTGLGGSGSGNAAGAGVNQGALGGTGAANLGGGSGKPAAAGQSEGGSAGGGAKGASTAGSSSTSGGAGISSGPAAGNGGGSGTSMASAGGAGGSGTTGAAGTGSTSPPIPATWDTVKLVLSGTRPPCNGCHGNQGSGGFRINIGNDSQLFKSLTTTVAKDCGNNPIVTPGDPTKSALLEILQGDCSVKTPRMPPGCVDGDSSCVPPEYITALSQWISAGAPEP